MHISSTSCDPNQCHLQKRVSFSIPCRASECSSSCHSKHRHNSRRSIWSRARAVSAENSVAVSVDKEHALEASIPLNVSVREARNSSEFEQIGWLRARAYYATRPPHRFQETFIKQFAQKEARSLIMRTRKLRDYTAPEIVCLVAVLPYSDPRTQNRGNVVGTVDIRPPRSIRGEQPKGVPEILRGARLNRRSVIEGFDLLDILTRAALRCHKGSERPISDLEDVGNGAHLLNLVVDADWRRQGCGTLMMDAAEVLVQKRWGAHHLYMEVAEANREAQSLYQRLGYDIVEDGGKGENLLLCKKW